MALDPILPAYLEAFIELARRGKWLGCSTGEHRAYRLALAILEDVPGLDHQAIEGLRDFIIVANYRPNTAEALINT